jgi:hypothetical protein
MVVAISVDGKVTEGEGRERGLKCSVQRKLRWVENGDNRSAGASGCGTGHYFECLIRHCRVLNAVYFRFRSVQQSYLAIPVTIGEALQIVFSPLPILLFFLCCSNIIGPVIRTRRSTA